MSGRGEIETAVGLLRRAIEAGPASPTHYTNLVLYLGDLGRLDEISKVMDEGLDRFPDNMVMRFWAVGDPKSSAYMGIGAFNLVRRSAFDKTEGFAWLKMEVADDVGLALLLKRTGAKSSFAIALNDVSLIWYRTVSAMFRGLEKNIFGATSYYSYFRMFFLCVLSWAYAFGPIIAFFFMVPLRHWGCPQCPNFGCILNCVPEEKKDQFLKEMESGDIYV